MKKRIALSVDEEIFNQLKFIPRGFSVSDFVNLMLKGMVHELKGGMFESQEEFNKWVNADPELKRVREAIRDAWGPALHPVMEKLGLMEKKKGKAKSKKKNV